MTVGCDNSVDSDISVSSEVSVRYKSEPTALSDSAQSNSPPQISLPPVSSQDRLNLLQCLDVTYESREQVPGVSYKTSDGKRNGHQWWEGEGREEDMPVKAPKAIVMEAKWMYLAQGWWGTRCVMKHLDLLFSSEDLLLGYRSKLRLWILKSQLLPELDLNLILKLV